MGYTYDMKGRLCCDFCCKSGGVRRIECPYGYCQPWATCPDCRREGKHRVASCGGGGTHAEICKPAMDRSRGG